MQNAMIPDFAIAGGHSAAARAIESAPHPKGGANPADKAAPGEWASVFAALGQAEKDVAHAAFAVAQDQPKLGATLGEAVAKPGTEDEADASIAPFLAAPSDKTQLIERPVASLSDGTGDLSPQATPLAPSGSHTAHSASLVERPSPTGTLSTVIGPGIGAPIPKGESAAISPAETNPVWPPMTAHVTTSNAAPYSPLHGPRNAPPMAVLEPENTAENTPKWHALPASMVHGAQSDPSADSFLSDPPVPQTPDNIIATGQAVSVESIRAQGHVPDGRPNPVGPRSAPMDGRPVPLGPRSAPMNGRPDMVDTRAAPGDGRPNPANLDTVAGGHKLSPSESVIAATMRSDAVAAPSTDSEAEPTEMRGASRDEPRASSPAVSSSTGASESKSFIASTTSVATPAAAPLPNGAPMEPVTAVEIGGITAMSDVRGSIHAPPTGNLLTGAQPTLAQQVAAQVAEVARPLPDGPLELTLKPEELGRLKLSFSSTEAGILVTVSAERPETLDLMRRNIEMLATEMKRLGQEAAQFEFSNGGYEQSSEGGGSQSDPHRTIALEGDPTPAIPLSTNSREAALRLGQAGLDLRL